MNLERSWKLPGRRLVSRGRAVCYCGAIAAVIVAALGAPARAQDAAADRKDAPAGSQDAAPAHIETPAPAQAAPERKDPPPPAQEAAPERKGPPPPAQEAAPARKAAPARAQKQAEPDRIRGLITAVEAASIVLQTGDGKTLRIGLPANLAVFSLTKATFADLDFGTYVGAVSVRLGDDIYSPIRRDSLSWLHKGFELRIIDEQLRGIAVGHTKWDLTPNSVMTHGWVDDMEDRVISIKYGPTEEEETDVEISRDVPILKMARGEKSLIKPGARVFAGAQKGADGNYVAVFVFVGKDGIVPPL